MSKIAVIDDCTSTLSYLNIILSHIGHDVWSFNRPLDAIKEVPSLNPDIVVCDYIMFDMVGLDVIDALREANVKAKYILLTSLDDNELRRICRERNIVYVLKNGTKTKIIEEIHV